MLCYLCETQIKSQANPISVDGKLIHICKKCLRKAQDDIFFDHMDLLVRKNDVMIENLSFFNNYIFKFYHNMQKMFFGYLSNCLYLNSKN